MFYLSSILGCYILVGFFSKCESEETTGTFIFKEFQYKDTPKNEITFREYETACEQSKVCSGSKGLSRTQCVRECVSPSCYTEIYHDDPILTALLMHGRSLFIIFIQYKRSQT